jgi:DNA primase small subunit
MLNVRETGVNFIERKFAEYYAETLEPISPISSFTQREFGFIPFTEKIMIRHRGFTGPEELKTFITSITPAHAYYSAAYYKNPEAPMSKKGWLGSDLIFDIDSDHIQTPCKNEHDYWICADCNIGTTRPVQGNCPSCGSGKLRSEFWLCETCLELAKAEILKLLDFLIADFGFQQREIVTCFSGHRGYHVHVDDEEVKSLDQAARKEIVDYLLGTGLNIEFHGLKKTNRTAEWLSMGPTLSDSGWRGRIAKGMYDLLLSSTLQQLEDLEGFTKNTAKRVIKNRDHILEGGGKSASWGIVKGVGPKTLKILAMNGAKKQTSIIDPVVTMDIHRLIRIPHSLHGKTGLKVVIIPFNSLEKFDPLKEAVAFPEGRLDVSVTEAPAFRLGNEVFGPYRHERVELPMAAGIYLLCKRAAKDVRIPS